MSIYKMGKIVLALLISTSLGAGVCAAEEGGIATLAVTTGETFTSRISTSNSYNDGFDNCTFENCSISDNYGGAININPSNIYTMAGIWNCTFTNNSAKNGGAIAVGSNGVPTTINIISGTTFSNNTATADGGAIYNTCGGPSRIGTISNITGCYFVGNVAGYGDDGAGSGGAIYNHANNNTGCYIGDIEGTYFVNNTATNGEGGAIYNDTYATIEDIKNCYFEGNKSTGTEDGTGRGGAIYNDNTSNIGNIIGCYFISNKADLYAGAIYNNVNATITSIEGSYFYYNEAKGGNGGAIENGWGTSVIGDIKGSYFEGNIAKKNESEATAGTTGLGAAIYNEGRIGVDENGTITGGISDSQFVNNTADVSGGAIYNRYNATENTYAKMGDITNCYFDGNTATSGSGGAIYNAEGCTLGTITNTSFVNNSAGEKGGAIYTTSDLTIAADGASVVFQGNTSGDGGDAIYMAASADGTATTLTFSLSDGGSIALYDSVSGEEGYGVNISGDGTFYLYNDLEDAALAVGSEITPLSDTDSGTLLLSTVNDEIHTYKVKSFTLADDFNMVADVDLENERMDRFVTTDTEGYTVTNGKNLTVSDLNLISDANSDRAAVYFAETGLMKNVASSVGTAYAPVHEYKIDYVYTDGDIITDANGETYSASESELLSSADAGGYFVFENIGYNPAVMTSSVAAMGAYNAMGMMFDYNFEHSDYFMKLPIEKRLAISEWAKEKKSKKQPKESDATKPAYYNQNELTERGAWFKSFYSNESVSYRGGWNSRDKYYGALVGFDTDLREHGDGWAHLFTGYVGTIGIRQSYSGGHIKQHGGMIGVTESFYKKNFYTAWTAAAGFTKAHEHTMYGHDTSRNDTWGIAGKFGWNFEFANGKYSLLPTITASYTTVDPENYTTAADVYISGSGVRAVQLNPNIKLIMNAENGLQPYLTVGEVWTVGQSSSIKANGEKLPELELKSYTEYGIGVQKRWANERDAYVQVLGHSDGRDGILVNAGIRWNF